MAEEPGKKEPEFRLVRIMGRRAWYVRFTEPGSGKSIVRSTGETTRAAAEKWLKAFKDNQGKETRDPKDSKFQALVKAWDDADVDTRSRFVTTLLKPIIGGK